MNSRHILPALRSMGGAATVVAAVLVSAPAALLAQLSAPSAQISGTVTDDTGNALPGVLVTFTLAPDPTLAKSLTWYNVTATDSSGSFTSPLLPAGTYLICGRAGRALAVLDNCEWTLFPPSVTVTASQALTGFTLVMPVGMNLVVRVNDPAGLVANAVDATKAGKGSPLLTQVWDTKGFVHSLPLRSFDAASQNLSLVVPFGGQFQLSISGPSLAITDKTGAVVQPGAKIPFTAGKTAPTLQYQFTVSAAAVTPATGSVPAAN